MIYSLTLETALVLVGLLMVATSLIALGIPAKVQEELRAFPRSSFWGTVMIFLATAWSWWLVKTIDLGEFTNWRPRLLIIVPVVGILAWRFVEEFLAARALGMLVLLAAEPLLESAWMRPEMSKLLLVLPVYIWITFALFWIGTPYTLRDQIAWVQRTPGRWKYVCGVRLAYGLALLTLSLTLRR